MTTTNKTGLKGIFKLPDKKLLLAGAGVLLILTGSIYMIMEIGNKPITEEELAGINFTVPDGKGEKIEKDKLKALDRVGRESETVILPDGEFSPVVEAAPIPAIDSYSTYRQVTTQLQQFDNRSNESEIIKQLQEEVKLLKEKRDKPEVSKEQLLEESYNMAARLMAGGQPTQQETVNEVTNLKETVSVRTVTAGDRTVSSLGRITLDEYLDENRVHDFITPVGQAPVQHSNTVSACIDQEQTITSGGPVRIRLLDGIIAGEHYIPANSVLTGNAVMGIGQRLEITIDRIETGGNIIPVLLVVHDIDGQKGLYVPLSSERNALKDAAGAMTNNLGSGISISRDAKQQVAMDVARTAIAGVTQYTSSKIKEVRVTLKSDYKVLLISSK